MPDTFTIVPREDATSYTTRGGAQIIANVLTGLETRRRSYDVWEIKGRNIFQIMAFRDGPSRKRLGWVRLGAFGPLHRDVPNPTD